MMNSLFDTIQQVMNHSNELPFSVYSSFHEQKLFNVPIVKPLLIFVIKGDKEIGNTQKVTCTSEQFIFLSNNSAINMRNIPKDKAYFALLIEFEHEDFDNIPSASTQKPNYITGETTPTIQHCLEQFVESAAWAPQHIWSLRRKEILTLLYQLGYTDICSMKGKLSISQQVHQLCHEQSFSDITTPFICEKLAMSESTLRRKLKLENTNVQEIKDIAKLGLGLHLFQTTEQSVHLIAERCGYSSPSRFTERFKNHFGLTPSALRKTKMAD